MGFYCSTQIVDDKNNTIRIVNTEKHGISYGNLCFREDDFTIDVPNHIYIAKTPVKKAAERINKIYYEIIKERNQKILNGMEYDEWSQKALDKVINFMETLMSVFEIYKTGYVYADLSEATYIYKKTEDIKPQEDFENQIKFLKNILNGCYLGRYPNDILRQNAKAFIEKFKNGLLKCDGILDIYNFGTPYDIQFFVLGNKKMMKFQMDIKMSNESIEKNYDIFDNVMLPIHPYFIQNGCDYEQNYSAGYLEEDGQVRIIVYKLIED